MIRFCREWVHDRVCSVELAFLHDEREASSFAPSLFCRGRRLEGKQFVEEFLAHLLRLLL